MTFGWPDPPRRCDHCGGEQYREIACPACAFPTFGMLGGMHMLAAALVAHFGHDPDEHSALVAELEQELGDEMLTIGREALARCGLVPDGEEASSRT